MRADAGDELTWQEEFCCIAVDEATAFLTYEMINNCKEKDVKKDFSELEKLNDLYLGYDVARKNHLSVITILEKINNVKYLRYQVEMRNVKFRDQKTCLYSFLKLKNLRRACIDRTGIGANIAEDAQLDFGKTKVEDVNFSNASKEEMSTLLYIAIEDRNLKIDINTSQEVIEDWHSIKKITTKANNTRLDTDDSDGRHADNFWSTALANYAASSNKDFEIPVILSGKFSCLDYISDKSNLMGLTGDFSGVEF